MNSNAYLDSTGDIVQVTFYKGRVVVGSGGLVVSRERHDCDVIKVNGSVRDVRCCWVIFVRFGIDYVGMVIGQCVWVDVWNGVLPVVGKYLCGRIPANGMRRWSARQRRPWPFPYRSRDWKTRKHDRWQSRARVPRVARKRPLGNTRKP